MSAKLYLPAMDHFRGRLKGGIVRRLYFPHVAVDGAARSFEKIALKGHIVEAPIFFGTPSTFAIIARPTTSQSLPEHVLIDPNGLPTTTEARIGCRWLRPVSQNLPDVRRCEALQMQIRESWVGGFAFKLEQRTGNDVFEQGLRPPQIGALHAILSHWTVTQEVATIVMPTGTGKTETMLSLLVAQRLQKVLVVVPTNALREQITNKFLTLGVLPSVGVLSPQVMMPIVGTLESRPKNVSEVDAYFRRCNIVVTTAAVLGNCSDAVTARISSICSHLIVDEAHHISAPSWSRIRAFFKEKPVLQFTATPYRGDGKLVDGKVIYNYPLRKAQQEGYFKPIRFLSVREYNNEKKDERIAAVAIKQLRADINDDGLDHLMMARCSTINRAKQLIGIYEKLAPDMKPVLAHSELSASENNEVVRRLRNRESRIVVCVAMFGEGFDLPELKVAALHNIHKSLAITLQFTGRFTRTSSRVGDATIVANIADVDVEESLLALYGEDPDWNHLLRELSEQATGNQLLRTDFIRGFSEIPDNIPLQNVFPKMSTVVYATKCGNWLPQKAEKALKNVYDRPALNPKERVAVLVTKEFEPVSWGDVRSISDTVYHLYVLYWDSQSNLLYIHSSNNGSMHEGLAKAVCGMDVAPINGERVFRVLYDVKRLILTNLGLGHSLSRAVRFTMHVGADIKEGLTEAHALNKFKTNIFGRGFEGGDKASIGCSRKGRIWSFKVAGDIGEWASWCRHIGAKLQNNAINVSDVLNGAMIPIPQITRPAKVPIAIEWSDDVLDRHEDAVHLSLAGVEVTLDMVSLTIADFSESGPLRFRIAVDTWAAKVVDYDVKFSPDRVDYISVGTVEPMIRIGKTSRPLSQYLQEESPVIWFHDGSFLIYNDLFEQPNSRSFAFDRTRIDAWKWVGVDIKKESQNQEKREDSIQRHVIVNLLSLSGDDAFDIVFDDDASGEAADIVAIRIEQNRLHFRLYHCKYAKGNTPTARLDDLYEVCGQAQTSVHWRGRPESLIEHLIAREGKRQANGGVSRFERGDLKTLTELRQRLRSVRPDFQIYLVQPGLSRQAAGKDHLELLAVTELHLKETYGLPLVVIASE